MKKTTLTNYYVESRDGSLAIISQNTYAWYLDHYMNIAKPKRIDKHFNENGKSFYFTTILTDIGFKKLIYKVRTYYEA